MQSRFGAPGIATRYIISQSSFDEWANGAKPRARAAVAVLLVLIAVACAAAIIVMGPRLAREGSLLWFGTRADGVIKNAEVIEVGKFKGGDPKYQLKIAYDFVAGDGKLYSGLTERGDIRTPPELQSGEPIDVYYSASNATNSVADYNLRTDVYALLLFLPWIAFFGIVAPIFYFRRWWNWRRHRRATGHPQHTSQV